MCVVCCMMYDVSCMIFGVCIWCMVYEIGCIAYGVCCLVDVGWCMV